MTSTAPQPLARLLLAVSGWLALAVLPLGPGSPVRVAVVAAFLLTCPGTAAMLLARPVRAARSTSVPDRTAAAVLAVALSAAVSALVAEAFFLGHAFTPGRALAALAAVTTVLALVPRRRGVRGRAAGGVWESSHPTPRTPRPVRPVRPVSRRRWAGYLAAAALLLFTTACGAAAGGSAPGGGSSGRTPVFSGSAPSDPGSGAGAGEVAQHGDEPSAGPAPAAPGPWHQVFRDDFSGGALDRGKWTTCYDWNDHGCTNSGNREKEWYLPGQVSVADGVLQLKAERKSVQGSDGTTYPWTSGMVSTGKDTPNSKPHRTFTYGYYAAAIKVPAEAQGEGLFPAFWLVALDSKNNPKELDIAEFINTSQYVDMNLHFGTDYRNDGFLHHQIGPADYTADFHVFALEWAPDRVTWYVDGEKQFQVTDPEVIPDEPMELVINLAVGYQQMPPEGVDEARVQVDWVAVWQH